MLINNVDFHNIEIQKYYAPPSTWSPEKRKQEAIKRIYSGEWYGALKRDGAFYKFTKSDNGEMELTGRSKSVSGDYLNKINWVPHLMPFFESLPNGTCLLGELYSPSNEQAKTTTSIMNCLEEKAIKRQEKEKLHYYIFDILADSGESIINMKAIDRFLILDDYKKRYKNDYVEWAEYYSGNELWNKLQEYLGNGLEGVVIINGESPYRPGKRSTKDTLKIKKELQDTIDLVIIGVNEPTKLYSGKEIENWEYWYDESNNTLIHKNCYKQYSLGEPVVPVTKNWFYNWAGSFKLGVYKGVELVHIGNLSGLTDEMKENWRDYIGKVAEVTAMEIHDTGGIRHPKLLNIREDKPPTDCTWESVYQL